MFALPRIYLASKSPRRRDLLKQIGADFTVLLLRESHPRGPDVNESPHIGEAPPDYVRRIAKMKAEIGWQRVLQRQLPKRPVLAADTAVCLGARLFGKPVDKNDARDMLHALSASEHLVLTCVTVRLERREYTALSESTVRFRELSEAEIDAYIATGEPMDKAGAYAIQGLAAAFIPEILGSYTGVMGLPLYETVSLLGKFAPVPQPTQPR